MENILKSLIGEFKNVKILVVGDAILDTYIKGIPSRVCREAPVLVFNAQQYEYQCGGAANTAINVAALGAEVFFLSAIGKDTNGKELLNELKKNKVHTDYIIKCKERSTLAKKRVMSGSNIMLRIDEGSEEAVSVSCQQQILENFKELYNKVDAVILSDYGYGIINQSLLEGIKSIDLKDRKPFIVDARDLKKFKCIHPTSVKPNYQEAVDLLGIKKLSGEERVTQITACEKKLYEVTHASQVVVTLDADGVLAFQKGKKPYRVKCKPADNQNAIGAGDTFISALALSHASKATSTMAVDIAAAAAAVVVQKTGTARCSNLELQMSFNLVSKYLPNIESVAVLVTQLRKQGKRIVFTNGCFDILHKGHITLLNEAKKEGDVLIVGINSDSSVKKVKGKGRPFNSFEDRVAVLTGLQSVDYLVSFEEDSPVQLIKTVHPDVYVKGENYSEESLREAPLLKKLNCQLKLVAILEDHSTTYLIDKIRDSYEGLKLSA